MHLVSASRHVYRMCFTISKQICEPNSFTTRINQSRLGEKTDKAPTSTAAMIL